MWKVLLLLLLVALVTALDDQNEEEQVGFWGRRRSSRRRIRIFHSWPHRRISLGRRRSKICCMAMTTACITCRTQMRPSLRGRRELLEGGLSEEQLADFLNTASEDQIADIFSEEELAETEGMSEEEVSDWFLKNLWKKIKKSGTKARKWVRKSFTWGKKKASSLWGKKKPSTCCMAMTPACITCRIKTGPFRGRIRLGGRRELQKLNFLHQVGRTHKVEFSAEEEQIADFLNQASEDQIADIFSEEELAETEGMSEEEVSDWFLTLLEKLCIKTQKCGTNARKWVRKSFTWGKKKASSLWGKKKPSTF